MRLYLAGDMRRADREAAAAGVPPQLLMEAAGRAVADSLRRNYPDCRRPLVLCGKGNNGGDGYVAARYLHLAGLRVDVLELDQEGIGNEAAVARAACRAHLPTSVLDLAALESALASRNRSEVVVDALFGSGLTRPLEGVAAATTERLNSGELPVLSVDVPSGVNADSPLLPGPHVEASLTVQLAGAKLASAFDPARGAFGRQELAPIGIPAAILAEASAVRLLTGSAAAAGTPRRERDAHKYRVGTVLVLAGSPRYLGAAELACRGAYRAGAGLVTLAAERRLSASWPEIVFSRLDWGGDPLGELAAVEERRAQAVVAGPGLDERALEHLPALLHERRVPWVLDAGALRLWEPLRSAVREHGRCVLTPHGGEAAGLLECSSEEIRARPVEAATRIAADWNATCVLKGGTTVVAGPGASLSVSSEGHSGMASGGTGDVLAGVIGAFLASGGDPVPRIEAAVAVHGRAGLLAGEALGDGLVASDLIDRLPQALQRLSHGGT